MKGEEVSAVKPQRGSGQPHLQNISLQRNQAMSAPPSCRSQHGGEKGEVGEQVTPFCTSLLSRDQSGTTWIGGKKRESIFV